MKGIYFSNLSHPKSKSLLGRNVEAALIYSIPTNVNHFLYYNST